MKKLCFILAAIMLIGGAVQAGAPTTVLRSTKTGDITVDSAYDVSYQLIDSLIIVAADSGTAVITVSGIARLDPGDVLWIGFDDDSIDVVDSLAYTASRDLDSVQVRGLGRWARGRVDMPFNVSTETVTYSTTTTDTIYVLMAVSGNAPIENVEVQNVVITAIHGSTQ